MSATKVKPTVSFTACLLGSSEDVSIVCAGQSYSGSVDNWHQFLYVFHQHPIEKLLIPFLDAHQVDVPVRKRKKNEEREREEKLNRIEGNISDKHMITNECLKAKQRRSYCVCTFQVL